MNYLSLENISKFYGERILFENISFGINKNQKIGFIAKNGSGKTSLLNIICEKDTSDIGIINKRKDLKISYLPQKDDFKQNITIREIIFNNSVSKDDINYWDFEKKVTQILTNLNINNIDKKVETLSGGQRKRVHLAKILIHESDLLILDEPTNHLDLEMIEWLEEYLNKKETTLLMVTHDRYFLDRVCNEILELDEGKIYRYKGNYQYFLEKREERLENEKSSIEKAKNIFSKELEWMRKQPKARTTKSKSRVDDFFKIEEKAKIRRIEHKIQLEINMERLGSKILELHNVNKSLDDKNILKDFKYIFKTSERIGIIGKNGTGKTTLLNLLTKKIEPDSGKIVIGETVKIGYYTQSGMNIKIGQKVIDVVKEYGDFIPLKKGLKISASQLLERFLFDSKKQYDYVEKLSIGEQKRLFLCSILIKNPNFLIFDEPTNDLDIVTLNVLENFLMDFPGNIIIVTHDRYFMDKIVDSLFIFKGNGIIENFPGNYSDYRFYENSNIKDIQENQEKKENIGKNSYKEQQKINSLENSIKKLNEKKKTLESLFNGDLSIEEINQKSIELEKIIKEITDKENEWLNLMENS